QVSPPGTRRRATFAVRRTAQGCIVGFHAAATTRIVALAECPVSAPAITALLPALAACLERCLPPAGSASVMINLVGRDLDIVIAAAASPGLAMREALAAFATAQDLARLSWRTAAEATQEPIVQRRPVQARFGDVAVALPPGAFLQATEAGERAIVAAVLG